MSWIPNVRAVLARAWSIRFIAAAFFFTVLEIALPYLDGLLPVSPRVFALLAGLSSAGAFVSRLVAQRGVTPCP